MTTVHLREGARHTLPLSTEDACWLQDVHVARCFPTRSPGHFDVRVDNVAGLLASPSLAVEIQPKLAVGELMWLVVYAATGIKLDPRTVQASPADVAEALSSVLAHMVSSAVSGGVPRGYWERDESSPTLRGRLRTTDQISKHLGRLYPLELSYHEFGVDIPENRIMKAACVHAVRGLMSAGRPTSLGTQAQLRRLIRVFDGVSPLVPGARLPFWRRTSQNAKAWAAVELSEMVLRGDALDTVHGDRSSTGLLVQVWRVFEAAVARGLQELRPDLTVATQRIYPLADDDAALTMRPDIVIEDRGRVIAVADTKYKVPNTSSGDLYQLFTYAKYLGLDESHLLYGEMSDAPRVMRVGDTGVRVIAHGLSLKQPSRELLPQLDCWMSQLTV